MYNVCTKRRSAIENAVTSLTEEIDVCSNKNIKFENGNRAHETTITKNLMKIVLQCTLKQWIT